MRGRKRGADRTLPLNACALLALLDVAPCLPVKGARGTSAPPVHFFERLEVTASARLAFKLEFLFNGGNPVGVIPKINTKSLGQESWKI